MKTPVVWAVILLLRIHCQRIVLLTQQRREGHGGTRCAEGPGGSDAGPAACPHRTRLCFGHPGKLDIT